MSQDATQLALVTGASVVVNTVSSIQRGKDPVVPIVAGGVVFVGLALFGGLTSRYDLSIALAWVFFLASFLFRGMALLKTSNTIATTAKRVDIGGGGSFGKNTNVTGPPTPKLATPLGGMVPN